MRKSRIYLQSVAIVFGLLSAGTLTSGAETTLISQRDGAAYRDLVRRANPAERKAGSPISCSTRPEGIASAMLRGEYVGDGPFMIGTSIVSSDEFEPGIYIFNEHGEIGTVKTGYTLLNATYGGVKAHGRYFLANAVYQSGKVINFNILYDVETWRELSRNEEASRTTFSYSMAEDPTDGTVYGCFLSDEDGNDLELGTIDIDRLERTSSIAEIEIPWMAMGFAEDGTLYALLQNGNFCSVDKKTGKTKLIGKTGIPMDYLSTGVMNRRDGKFYYASCTDDESKLYAIDLSTGKATQVIDFGMFLQMRGMFMWDGLAEDKAPLAAQNLEADFAPGALSGNIKFHVPELFYDGSPASGPVSYRIERTGTEVASGTTDWGRDESVPFEVDHAAPYRISVYLTNEAGTSPEASLRVWLGNDYPAVPANISVERSGDNNIITWDAVTEGAHHGYVDPAEVTYNIMRYPDETILVTGLKTTTYTDLVPEPEKTIVYRYEVCATFDERTGEAGTSDVMPLGALRLPFVDDFTALDSETKYKIIDANMDGNTWEFNHQKRGMFVRHNSIVMDDWLITPPFRMEAGKLYTVSFTAIESLPKYGPEKIEAYYGQSPTVAGMTNQLVGPTLIYDSETLTGTMSTEETGTYYLGIHGISDPNAFYLYVTDIKIEDGVYTTSPARGTLDVIPDYNGNNTAEVHATAPTHNVSGDPVCKLVLLQLLRDDKVIYEVTDPEPGETYTYADEVPDAGYYMYGMKAYDAAGAGKLAEFKAHVGMQLAAAPTNVKMVEKDDTGKVKITWDAPETDIDGFAKNPDMLSYSIFDYDNEEVASYLNTRSFIYQAGDASKQRFVLFYVHAESPAGLSESIFGKTPLTAVGPAYTLPFYESCGNGILAHLWAQAGGGDWMVLGACEQPKATAADEDGGMLAWKPVMTNTEGRLFSGKIALVADTHPSVSFSYFGVPDTENTVKVGVRNLTDASDMEEVAEFRLSDGEGWTRAVTDISRFAGKNVEISIIGVCADNTDFILLDDLRIIDMMPDNLTANTITSVRKVTAGDSVPLTLTVDNNGSNDATEFTVNLYCNRAKVDSKTIELLKAGRSADVEFSYKTTPFTEENLILYAVVDYKADGNTADNTSERVSVEVAASPYPRVTDLALKSAAPVAISWLAPELDDSDAGETVESFEDFDAFIVNPDSKWTFIDGDGIACYAIPKVTFAGNGGRMAYVVIDDTTTGLNNTYKANSGHKYIAALSSQTGRNDDWMISPELTGEQQTISFFAKTYSAAYDPEAFEVLYSEGSMEREDFVEIGRVDEVPSDKWTRYEYPLPTGAKRFAIRCVSPDSFIFMVDDITYQAASITSGLELEGYNVYRDEQAAGAAIAMEFTDADVTEGSHTYHVTARYNKGESQLSAPLEVEISGVVAVSGDGVRISVEESTIDVETSCDMPVEIYTDLGIKVLSAMGSVRYGATGGVYLVRTGNKVTKVII